MQLLEKVLVLSLPFLRRAALLRTIMLGAPLPSDAASGGALLRTIMLGAPLPSDAASGGALLRTIMLGAPLPSDAASGGGLQEATELVHHLRIPGGGRRQYSLRSVLLNAVF
ncbi:hypothetical protein T484DRAFT_1805761 [Baffinella frigidus]|nr:hypothetical protein T484DRAFT_1805761 [Cryptophyta sp. CCMP2293]